MIVICTNCGSEWSDTREVCPTCRAGLPSTSASSSKRGVVVAQTSTAAAGGGIRYYAAVTVGGVTTLALMEGPSSIGTVVEVRGATNGGVSAQVVGGGNT